MKINAGIIRFVFCVLSGTLGISVPSFAFSIKNPVSAGSGCKADQPVNVTGTENSILIRFPEMSTAKDAGKRLSRANCNSSITIETDGSRQFRPSKFNGPFDFSAGNASELTLKFSSWFQGQKQTSSSEINIKTGSAKGSGAAQSDPSEEIWSPCEKNIVFNSGVSMVAKSKSGLSKDVSVTLKDGLSIELAWRPCKGTQK